MSDQFELFERAPWVVRQRVPDSLELWWIYDWSLTAKSKTTVAAFKRLQKFWTGRFDDELAKPDMEALIRYLQQLGLGNAAVNTHHTMATRWMSWLGECKALGIAHGIDWRPISVPAANIGSLVSKLPEKPRGVAWPKSLVHKLVAICQRLDDQFMADLIESLYISKVRLVDHWHMEDGNVDLAHLIVAGTQHKSINRRRPIGRPYLKPLTPRLETIYRRRIEQARRMGWKYLWRDPAYSVESWRRRIDLRFAQLRDLARLGTDVQLRDMKPSAATLELDNGIDSQTVAQGMGHKDERHLPVYARRNLTHQRRAQELLEDAHTEIIQG